MKTFREILALVCVITISVYMPVLALNPDAFEKYELVSTEDRSIAGVDVNGLVAYGKNHNSITAYDIITDTPLFEFGENQEKIAPFYIDETAVIIGKTGYACGIVSKEGTLLAQLPEAYVYNREYGCGFIQLVDKNAQENVYTITDRRGNILVEHFFEPECELENKNIIVADGNGGYLMIKPDGSVIEFPCKETMRIENAVSICTGVYVGTDGNLYSQNHKKIYENLKYYKISPIDEAYAIGVKKNEKNSEKYIINIKDKKDTIIEYSDIFNDHIYSEGHVCDNKAFVGNFGNSMLINLKNGKVISPKVESYSCFYHHISTVKLSGKERGYSFLKCDGTFLTGEYVYASDFKGGYAVTVEKTTEGYAVYLVDVYGKKCELYRITNAEKVENADGRCVKFSVGKDSEKIIVGKASGGNVYISNNAGKSYVYVFKNTTPIFKAWAAVTAVIAMAIIAISVGYAINRKRVNTDEKSE